MPTYSRGEGEWPPVAVEADPAVAGSERATAVASEMPRTSPAVSRGFIDMVIPSPLLDPLKDASVRGLPTQARRVLTGQGRPKAGHKIVHGPVTRGLAA
jgi:hypothetical protein